MPRNKRWKRDDRNPRYRSRNFHSDGHPQRESTQLTSSSAEKTNEDELVPGFYYDKEKKRYFKLAPNHATSTCSYTSDAISQKNAEIKRQEDVKKVFEKDILDVVKQSVHRKKNLTSLVMDRSTNGHNKHHVKVSVLQNSLTSLKPSGSQNILSRNQAELYDTLEHMLGMHIGPDHDDILGLWSITETWVQRIQRVSIEETARSAKQCSLSVVAKAEPQTMTPIFNKATDFCWAPMKDQGKCILYTTMCHMGRQNSSAVLKSIDPSDTPYRQHYDIGMKATWSCAWNGTRDQFGVGSEKCALVLNVGLRILREYNTNKSDALCVNFSKHNGIRLYAGTRKGQILTFDMRSKSSYPVCSLDQNWCVCSVQELDNEYHVLSADFHGQICLWDLRKRKVVIEYPGNVNLYSKLPVHVDEYQKIVYTVGEDGYTRFWSLSEGRELYTIPPPCAVTRETIPCVQLSTRWGNKDGNMGLIMGLKDKFYYYGTLPLT